MKSNTSPHRISTEITSEKIKIMNDIDLNALFNLNYNFDLLKGIIEQLLKNQNALQNQIDELYGNNGDKDKRIENLEKEVKYLKETYVNRSQLKEIEKDLKEIKERLKKHDIQIEESKKYNYIIFIFVVLNKLKLIEDKLKDLEAKISNLSIRIGKLEGKNNDLEKLKKELQELKDAHGQTLLKVISYKEQIDLILARLNDIIKGYKDGDGNLQKEIDEINKKLELLLKLPKGEGKSDLSALNELMKKIIDLENEYREFVEKVNIDEIYRQLKYLHETKADKKDLNDINKAISDLNEKYDNHQVEIDAINRRLDALFSQLLNKEGGETPTINIDFAQYVSKIDFEKHKKENDEEFKKIWEEIEKLKSLINKIFEILKTKANLSDLEDLKNFLLKKIDELALGCIKKFADKNETTNNFKYLEDQIKKILDMLSKKDSTNDAENWLLAKKPVNGYSCAACESYIGDLRDDTHKFIPWNKMPLRDPGDKLYRMGNGFSKMLQMLNFDNNGNVSLNPNIINEATMGSNESNSRIASAFPVRPQINMNNNNNVKPVVKKRIQSANPKGRTDLRNINKMPQPHFKEGDKSGYISEIPKNKNELFPDIYESGNGKNEEGPKITRVFRKTSSKKGGSKDNSAIS